MSSDQVYYLTVALINLILAFAATRIKPIKGIMPATPFLIWSFFAFASSWFLYSLDLTLFIEIISTILSTAFVWGVTIFSFKRCDISPPFRIISILFLLNISFQTLFTIKGNLSYVMHTGSIFIPIAFGTCGYLFLKKKLERSPSDVIVAHTFFILIAILITRSILLETSSELFSLTVASTQIMWPIFSVVLGVFLLLSYTEEVQNELTKDSITDMLTGLFNRRMFDTQFSLLLPALSRQNTYGALIYIDLDKFKSINDQYGHAIGDKVLIEFATRLKKSSRNDEIIARIGGDEFTLLIDNAGQDSTEAFQAAQTLAMRIQGLMQEPLSINEQKFKMTCSIGVHILTPDSKDTQSEVNAADEAMYQAKKDKQGSIVFSKKLNIQNYGSIKAC